jgi:hypothetical protein
MNRGDVILVRFPHLLGCAGKSGQPLLCSPTYFSVSVGPLWLPASEVV